MAEAIGAPSWSHDGYPAWARLFVGYEIGLGSGVSGRFQSEDGFLPIVPPWRRTDRAHASSADQIRAALITDSQRHAGESGGRRERAVLLWLYCLRSLARRVRRLGDTAEADEARSKLWQFFT